VVQDVRRHLVDSITHNGQALNRGIIALLAGAPASLAESIAVDPNWSTLWERGLFRAIAQMSGADVATSEAAPPVLPHLAPREFSGHAGNVTFALTAGVVFSALSPADQERVQRDAAQRADDERVAAIQRLLTTLASDAGPAPVWHVWTVLRETLFRRAYLPWSSLVEAEAFPGELLERSFDVRVISA
jgi:hypothetical protein